MTGFEIVGCIIIFLLILMGIAFLSYEYYERKTGVPTFPTTANVQQWIIKFLKSEMPSRQGGVAKILDLGSGSGQLSFRLAKAFPESHVTGIELSCIPWLRSILRQKIWGGKNLTYLRQDFWNYDISSFDVVITYLPGTIMERVGEKLHQELKSGSIVIANGFHLRAGWEPVETDELDFFVFFKTKLFVYRKV